MDRSHYLVAPRDACDPAALHGLTARAVLRATVDRAPDGIAYVDGELRLSWRGVAERVDALAAAFERAGIGAGDVVGLHLPNSAAYAIAHLAIAEVGAVTLPLHMPYGTAELQQFLDVTGAVAYVHAGDARAELDAIRGALPALQVVVPCALEKAAFAVDGVAGPRRARPAAIDPDAPFCVVPTSGTESPKPKLCMHAHDGLLSNARAFVDEAALGAGDVVIVGSGFTHLFGLLGLHATLIAGATLLALHRFEPRAFLALAQREEATRAWAVPAQLIDLVAEARTSSYALRLREVRTAGAAVGAEFVQAVRASLGAAVTVHWGMSELGGGITTYGRDMTASPTAIGTPIALAEVRIARSDGSEAAAGETGELWYRRADMFRGYYGDPQTTAGAVTPEGWLRSGDLAARDADGVVHFHGREKDIVNRGGYKISAAEVEAALHGIPGVRRWAVVAVPDERLGERACLVAELQPGTTLTLDAVAAHLDARGIAKYKWPERLLVVDALPMTATNKVAKSAVRALALAGVTAPVHA